MAADLLASISAEIDVRMAELRPLVEEYRSLLTATEALGVQRPASVAESPAPSPAKKRGRPKTTSAKSAAAKPAAKAPATRRRMSGPLGSAAGAVRAAATPAPPAQPRQGGGGASQTPRTRAVRGAAQQAILAALEHGSHSVSELAVVTAMSGQNIRENLRRMLGSGVVTRAKREGKAAYALAGGSEH